MPPDAFEEQAEAVAPLETPAEPAVEPSDDALKAGRVLSATNAGAIRMALEQLIDVLRRAGIDVTDVQPDESPEAVLERKGVELDDLRLVALGGAVKALDNGAIGGYLVEYGDEATKDLQGERFVPETDFALDWYEERPLLFHHGLDGAVKTAKIGVIQSLTPDDKGVWMQAVLDERNEYVRYVKELINRGALGLSSGALPHLVEIDGDGTIKRWTIVEGSLTHMPADPRTRVMPLKGLLSALPQDEPTDVEETATEEAPVEERTTAQPASSGSVRRGSRLARKGAVKAMYDIEALEAAGLTPEQIVAVLKAQKEKESGGEMEAPAEELADAAAAVEVPMKTADVEAAVAKALDARFGAPEPQSRVGGVSAKAQITDVRDMRYHHLSAQDLVFGAHVLEKARQHGLSAKGASEAMLRAAAEKVLKAADRADGGYGDGVAIKAAIGVKANEMFASNLASNGQEWVGAAYETQMWETVRNATIYQTLLGMGAMEVEIPQGFNSIYIPTEGSDPTFYNLVEQNDETSDERLPITAKSSNVTATRRQLSAGFIGARVSFSDIMEEDSLVPVLPFLRRKMETRGQEVIEYVILNGDTETGATGNINSVDAQPSVDAKGRGPVYLAFDGFLKLALVTTSALSRSGTTFDETDFLETIKLLPSAEQVALDRMAFIVDPFTYLAALNITAFKTRDVFNPATIENGRLTNVYGVNVHRSGQMAKANSAGKISATPGNNTLGRLLLVRPDQWALGYKRQMRTEVARDIDAQATVVVTTMRFGMTYRVATGGAAVTYNLTI